MVVPLPFLILLFLVLVAAAGLAWRYFALRRRIHQYARLLRKGPHPASPPAFAELEDLEASIRGMVSNLGLQLSELVHERDRLAAILDQLTDGVLIVDGEGRVRLANPAARRFFAVPEPIGRSIAEVLRNHQLIEVWRSCQQTGRLQTESVEIPARQQYLQFVAIPDRMQEGSLLLVQDLTRVRRLETIRRDFVSNLSHELRTPLASLKALTETLQAGALADPEARPRFLDRMVTEVDALSQMAQEMLDLSRIESGQAAPEFSNAAPIRILSSAVDRMKVQAERAGLTLALECAGDLPEIHADASRLEQVLVNLIHNAIKFTDPGGKIVVSAAIGGEAVPGKADGARRRSVRFSVVDNGIGIPADDVPRIFERFYRVDKARSAGGGTGLGLSIARHIVEAHGGVIWAESLEGHGSTFYFTIPTSDQPVD